MREAKTSSWADQQAQFCKALQEHDQTVPTEIVKTTAGTPPKKRFNVYRNNVRSSLTKCLEQTFPVTSALVGPEFFRAMAHEFIKTNMPKSPLLWRYGDQLPAFISAFEPAEAVPYLSDIAAIEWARNTAFYGADAPQLTIEALSEYPEEALPSLTFQLHPTLSLIRSKWPIVSIWQAHQTDAPNMQTILQDNEGECALIIRCGLSLNIHAISGPTDQFIRAHQNHSTFSEAVSAAMEQDSNFSISEALAGLFKVGAVTAINETLPVF